MLQCARIGLHIYINTLTSYYLVLYQTLYLLATIVLKNNLFDKMMQMLLENKYCDDFIVSLTESCTW